MADLYDRHLQTLLKCQTIKESEVKELCVKARDILTSESNVHKMPAPCTVVGDIHGQFLT